MTDNAKELRYMFADLEDEKVVKYPNKKAAPQYGGPGDDLESFITPIRKGYNETWGAQVEWVALVPDTPIPQCPLVEYYTGYWHIWESDPLPVPIPPKGPSVVVSVFLVPRSSYDQLNEERDRLTEIRMNNISKRTPKAPSTGAHVSTFISDAKSAPLGIGRPKSKDLYPVPLSLLQAEFAKFKQDVVSGPLDRDLSPLAHKWRNELSSYLNPEKEREAKFRELLSELFDGWKVSKKKFNGYTTDGGLDLADVMELLVAPLLVEVKTEFTEGGCDAVFEIVLYYLEGVRFILEDDALKGDWRKTRLPSLLIVHNGPNIQALGAVNTGEIYVEPLSSSVPLYFNEFDSTSMEILIRFMSALRRLFRSLHAIYQKPVDHAVDVDQITFPYVRSYKSSSDTVVPFKYVERVSDVRLVFTACTENNRQIIVKFGSGQYGVEAHKAAAQSNLAPALLSHTDLTGGWWMVVMEALGDEWTPCDEIATFEPSCKDMIQESVRRFHELGFVHGDLRDTNVFVRSCDGKWECQLIDYDWAGREGEVVYPTGVYNSTLVWRPEDHMDGLLITFEHDRQTVSHFLRRRIQ
ncbi:hypothetical protein BDP27DRAFT_1336206 [Rhodocollybia butyracea]|uniref:Protein kinase domain-containing protein n=1 Tax=Rhodocollybia butyracea TaxID=206335 RepID=A0A9P5U2J3_9AGAR|nr:hypothetical protein BDP27DRAFT_1336206 [Rhodocollybia butyracea]